MNGKSTFLPAVYLLRTSRWDLLWLPTALMLLFVILAWIVPAQEGATMMKAFLGGAMPLLAGILGAYAILEDPALELHFATPRPAWLTLLERLGAVLVILGVNALVFEGLMAVRGAEVSFFGGFLPMQMAWLVPALAMLGLGCATAFLLTQPNSGAMIVGLAWIFQVIAKSWMEVNPTARYFYLFMGALQPGNDFLPTNQASLLLLAALFLLSAWMMMKRQERYI